MELPVAFRRPTSPLDSLINPIRAREAVSRTVSLADVNRVVAELQQGLEKFSEGR